MTQTTTASRIEHEDNGASRGGAMDIATTRAAQEIIAAMTVAKKFPRDEIQARGRILQACKRKRLAEQSQYTFPRGNTTVNGPSIRLAECLAQSWGNMESGVVELERRDGESTAMSYAIDLETNTRDIKIFTIRHIRDTKKGPIKLYDERDIYEMVANTGARRKRACILAVIPGDVVEEAQEECDKTMAGDNSEPLIDRVRKMVQAFTDTGVTQEMIEKRLGHRVDVTTEAEIVSLRKIFASIRDNMAPRESFFDLGSPASGPSRADELHERLNQTSHAAPQPVAEPASTGTAIDPGPQAPNQAAEGGGESQTHDPKPGKSEATDIELREAIGGEWSDAAKVMFDATDGACEAETFVKALSKWTMGLGKKGKESSISFEARKKLYAAIKAGKFDFSSGKIVD